jgi:hypothetical protein
MDDLTPLRDFFAEVNTKKGCRLSDGELDAVARVMGENGFGLVRDIKQLSPDWMGALGMPPSLIEGIQSIFASSKSANQTMCGICTKAVSGPSQLLECKHEFDPPCINKYINDLVAQKKAVGIRCPVPECGRELRDAIIKGLLMPSEFQIYEAAVLASFFENNADTFKCPGTNCNATMSVDRKKVEPPKGAITETDDDGKLLTKETYVHFASNRIRCHVCNTNFCATCKIVPYHKGFTCETYKAYSVAKHCRFCSESLSGNMAPNPPSASLRDVCTDEDCIKKRDACCRKMLACGCPCQGVKDEAKCLPCIKCDLHSEDEWCCICYTETLKQAPCIQLTSCNHVYHFECVKGVMEAGQSGARIQFDWMGCPQDKKTMTHPSLDDVCRPILKTKGIIEGKALARLNYEGRMKDPKMMNKDAPYFNDPVAFAMHEYLFYNCFKCKGSYFAGGYQCDPSDNLWDPEELVCAKCQPKCVKDCDKHGGDWIAFKCRFCCANATFFCWGTCHFCANCHKPDTWKTLAIYKTGANKKAVWEYPQCASLAPKVTAIGNDRSLSDDAKMKKLEVLFSDPKQCPLGTRHPPNGMEHGMGCSMCSDKDDEEANMLAAAKAMEEKSGTFRPREDFGTCGIIYFLGTQKGKQKWQNPGDRLGAIKVTSSAMYQHSLAPQTILGRTPALCIADNQQNAWFLVNLITQSVTPTHYTLRHAATNDDMLRNWRFLGSHNGKDWTTLKEHVNDTSLKTNGGTCTWPIALPEGPSKFRCFCIMQTGVNSSNRLYLACSGFELYGQLHNE